EARNLPRPRRLRDLRDVPRGISVFQKTAWTAAALAAIVLGIFLYQQNAGVATGVGEQRMLALDDGTHVILNTDTRVRVDYERDARRIELDKGEALFEVAHDAARPFFVTAGDRRIQALGTSFAVRRDESQVAVTLVDGKVTVASLARNAAELP